MENGRRNFCSNILTFCVTLPWISTSCSKVNSFENSNNHSEVKRILTPKSRIKSNDKLSCSLNSDGSKCVFPFVDNNEVSIAIVDFETSSYNSFILPENIVRIESIAFSRDGRKITFSLIKEILNKSQMEIWIVNIDGKVELILSDKGRIINKPAFSPNGSKLAFYADMRHQYLGKFDENWDIHSPASVGVHELNIESGEIRLLNMPILPTPSKSFYLNSEIFISSWVSPIEDFVNVKLPVNCNMEISYKSMWQLYPARFRETVGQVKLLDGPNGKFEKFEFRLPKFNSNRDYFYLSGSSFEQGVLAELYLWDSAKDPTIEELHTPRYDNYDIPSIGLSWFFNDGTRSDIILHEEFTSIPSSCGSFDQSRIVVWAGLNNESAIDSKFPWTKSNNSEWHLIDLKDKYKINNSIIIEPSNNTRRIEIPKLIDKNGIGRTFEYQYK